MAFSDHENQILPHALSYLWDQNIIFLTINLKLILPIMASSDHAGDIYPHALFNRVPSKKAANLLSLFYL